MCRAAKSLVYQFFVPFIPFPSATAALDQHNRTRDLGVVRAARSVAEREASSVAGFSGETASGSLLQLIQQSYLHTSWIVLRSQASAKSTICTTKPGSVLSSQLNVTRFPFHPSFVRPFGYICTGFAPTVARRKKEGAGQFDIVVMRTEHV